VVEYLTQNPNIEGSKPASDTGREKIAEKKLCSFFIFGVCSVEHITCIFSMTLVNCQHQKKMSNIIWTLQNFSFCLYLIFFALGHSLLLIPL
jgi:hypothetical protein